jgi:hypothetical protein
MTKYMRSTRQAMPKPRPWDVNPIWRGIGCFLFLIGPFVAYAVADLIVQMNLDNGWYSIPGEMLHSYTIPYLNFTTRHFFANLLATGLLLLLGFAVIMVVYSVIYALVGPSRYGPMDARPIHRKMRRSR